MRKIEIDEQKKLEIDILDNFVSFCKKHNLRYSLAYGTLLGAVRHQGFIPWDDDIDVWMPRPDYDFLINNYQSERYDLLDMRRGDYYLTFAKLSDNRTVISNTNNKNMGLFIDIFPLDGLPHSLKKRKRFWNIIHTLNHLYVLQRSVTEWKTPNKGIVPSILRFVHNTFMPCSKFLQYLDRKRRTYNFNDSQLSAYLTTYNLVILETDDFNNMLELAFEGKKYLVVNNYHTYLTQLYGDYMTPPPPEKRTSGHSYDVYYKEERVSN